MTLRDMYGAKLGKIKENSHDVTSRDMGQSKAKMKLGKIKENSRVVTLP